MIHYCGRGSMVELELPKLTTRVRFPSPAPWNPKPGTCSLAFFIYENVAGLESVKWAYRTKSVSR